MSDVKKDKYKLNRFVEAQREDYANALNEIKNGEKESHWMWYIFPQVMGLGFTGVSITYSIKDLEEAAAYLQHEILGKRLVEISNVLLALETNNAQDVFGRTDVMKLKSSMTLFSMVSGADKVFQQVLDKFFKGEKDQRTLQLLNL